MENNKNHCINIPNMGVTIDFDGKSETAIILILNAYRIYKKEYPISISEFINEQIQITGLSDSELEKFYNELKAMTDYDKNQRGDTMKKIKTKDNKHAYMWDGTVTNAVEIIKYIYEYERKNTKISILQFINNQIQFIGCALPDLIKINKEVHDLLSDTISKDNIAPKETEKIQQNNLEPEHSDKMTIQQAKLMPANSKFEIYFNDNKDDNTVILVQDTCKKNNKIFQWMEDSGQKSPLWVTNEILDAKFVLIQEPVDIMTVMKSNKKCKVNHELINAAFEIIGTVNYYDNYDEFNNLMRNLSKDFNGIDLKRIMMEGEWFLEP